MKNLKRKTLAVRIVAFLAASAIGIGLISSQVVSAEKQRLKEDRLGDTEPVHAYGDIYLAGQPSPEDLPLLESEGIKTIISLRHEKELPWDEESAVKQNGMDFVHVPFSGAKQLEPEVFDKVLRILRDKRRMPAVLHCERANRVGAIWFAYRVLDGNLSHEEAMKEAEMVGLRTPEYLEKAQQYIEQVQKSKPSEEN